MNALIFLFLSGCTADYTKPAKPPEPAYTDPGLDKTGASPAYALSFLEAEYHLPDHSRPGGTDVQTLFDIAVSHDQAKTYSGRLPISVGTPRGYPPAGIVVKVDGKRIEYGDKGMKTWSGERKMFHVRWPTVPDKVIIEWPDLAHQLARRSYADSGLDAEDFVRWSATIDGETRQGMLLPAPATAEWKLDLPKGAPRFEAWITMDHTPLPDDLGDGAAAVLEVVSGGETVEVSRMDVAGTENSFRPFRADLSKWAGQSVTVRLRTDPGANPDHDYLFWGSPTIWGAARGPVRRVIVVGIDTTRPDHFGFNGYDRPTSPELDAIAANAALFDFAWTPAPRTRPSFRSATTGRTPLEAVGATTIGEVFQDHGFATAGFVANVHLQPRFGFSAGFDRWIYDNGAKAETQVDRALEFIRANLDRDTYTFLHLLDPHIFYDAPGSYGSMFVTTHSELPARANRWEVYKRMEEGKLGDGDKAYLKARYDGEIAYTSYQLGRLFHELDELGGRTLVIVHSDHGEEFWEHGGFEHNHSLYTDTTHALLMVRPGTGFAGGKRIDTPVTLADIAPTLYDYAGFDRDSWPELDGRSLRPLIEGDPPAQDWERPISIGHLRYGHEQWAVVADRHKYLLHTGSGLEELYDLAADPGEQHDLLSTKPDLGPWRRALADAHHMPVCPGFRIHVRAPVRSASVNVYLPEVPLGIEILDPERTVEKPSNQAWGMAPTRTPEEIGTIDWEPGSKRFTWNPGSRPLDGQIFVFYDHDLAAEGTVITRGPTEVPLELTPIKGGVRYTGQGLSLQFESALVVSPPVSEAERMRLLKSLDQGAAGGSDLETLIALGYVDADEHGHDEAADDDGMPPHEPEGEPTPEGSDGTVRSSAPPAARGALTAQACRW